MNEEKKNPAAPSDDSWLDELLGSSAPQSEIGPDEQAVAAAGLTHPDDLELEKIVQETLAENWGAPEEGKTAAEEPTQMFRPVEAPAPQEQPAPVQEEQPAPEKRTARRRRAAQGEKARPEGKKGYGLGGVPHIIATAILVAISVFIGFTLGMGLWLGAADLLAFKQEPPEALSLIVKQDDTVEDVAQQLKEKGLIRYPELFVFFAELTGKGDRIAAGTYVLNPVLPDGTMPTHTYDYSALLSAMRETGPARQTVKIMFPEGSNCAQIFALLEEKGVCTVAELEAYAATGELDDYWFLEGVERGHKYCLEGFLAPDTYEFYTNDDPERVLDKFLYEFDDRFTDRMHTQFEQLQERQAKILRQRGYGDDFIEENKLTLRQVVTLASMVEKESANDAESFDVASVFFNRLCNPGNYPFLNSDATILYATQYYNKGELTTDALINESPYNTYTHRGLPAGPITNPGANSLYAALTPNETGYYYFIYDEDAGFHRFSKTLAEHESWGRKLGVG